MSRNQASGYSDYEGQPAPTQYNGFLPGFQNGQYTGLSQAVWTVEGNDKYLVYGGEFVAVNGASQQGLVRFSMSGGDPNANKGDDNNANKGGDPNANKGDDNNANKGGDPNANKGDDNGDNDNGGDKKDGKDKRKDWDQDGGWDQDGDQDGDGNGDWGWDNNRRGGWWW